MYGTDQKARRSYNCSQNRRWDEGTGGKAGLYDPMVVQLVAGACPRLTKWSPVNARRPESVLGVIKHVHVVFSRRVLSTLERARGGEGKGAESTGVRAPSPFLLSNLMSSGLVSMSMSVKRRSFSVRIFSPPSTT